MELFDFEDDTMLEAFYKANLPKVIHFVNQNNGTEEVAKDVMQEAMMAFIRNIRKPNFILTSKLETYFFAIAKKMWLSKLRGQKYLDDFDENAFSNIKEKRQKEAKQERVEFIRKTLKQLGQECQELIKMFYFWKMPFEEIERIKGFSKGYGRLKKKRCMNKLKKITGQKI